MVPGLVTYPHYLPILPGLPESLHDDDGGGGGDVGLRREWTEEVGVVVHVLPAFLAELPKHFWKLFLESPLWVGP